MEHAKDKLKADIGILLMAITTLETALSKAALTGDDVVRDGAIQRFEYSFELAWKTLKVASQYMGIELNSPREAIKAGFKMGWIREPDLWFEAMEARNKTSHIYHEPTAKDVYEVAKKFPLLAREIITKIGQLI